MEEKREKIKVKRNLLLEPCFEWENEGIFNPTAVLHQGKIHIIYRGITCENYSRLGYAQIKNTSIERKEFPLLSPTEHYEKQGMEDPRVTFLRDGDLHTNIGNSVKTDKFYLLYTAFDGKHARIGAAESENLLDFKKIGIISPNITFFEAIQLTKSFRYKKLWTQQLLAKGEDITIWDKDGCLFPEKVQGKYAMLHRLDPDIQIVYFNDFFELKNKEFWEEYFSNIENKIVMQPEYSWEEKKVGAGPSPIKTKYGWLLLYHGVDRNNVYRAGVSLLDGDKPEREIVKLPLPLFEPSHKWEKAGNVPNVIFPTGAVVNDNLLTIFYGCSDIRIGFAEIFLEELLELLMKEKR